MNIFPLVKLALDDAFRHVPGSSKKKKYAAIKNELDRLAGEYANLNTYKNIDYSNATTRFAYVYKYVTSHARMVCDHISGSPALRQLFKNPRVQMTCIGGGPGSDLLGALAYLEPREVEMKLSCQIFDRETAWGDTWADLAERVDCDVRVYPTFTPFDVTKPETWKKFDKYLESDFVTMIYFMSEVYGLKKDAEAFFAHLMGNIKKGTIFLFIDNNTSNFAGWFDSLAAKHGLEILDSGSGNENIPSFEEKRDLGEHFTELPDSSPKLRSNVAWRVARKT